MGSVVSELIVNFTYLPGGYKSAAGELLSMSWLDFEDFCMVVHLVASKEVAPCILPCTIKPNGTGSSRTKTGRRRVTDADVAHLLIGDFDHGNLDAHIVEEVAAANDIAAIIHPTWKSGGVHGQRWRVISPLAAPIPARDYPKVWMAWAVTPVALHSKWHA